MKYVGNAFLSPRIYRKLTLRAERIAVELKKKEKKKRKEKPQTDRHFAPSIIDRSNFKNLKFDLNFNLLDCTKCTSL